ncbi:MAG: esterase [Paramuribaculum sp.]|nr:esterase [Paramuribaculum sp.]MDE6322610.1 esterase [Paramuribaculum sp.]
MRNETFMLACLALAFFSPGRIVAADRTPDGLPRYEMVYGDMVRTYSMFIPDSLPHGAPLVVYAHGYGSKTRSRKDLNEAARRHGFAVCNPDGSPDSRGKDGWKVGYPSQGSMTVDEADFFRALLDEVASRFGVSRENVFLAGMSNGGDLCYQFAYTSPELFRAYGSVAGLTFEETYNANKLTEPVAFIEIHGTSDTVSSWDGDHLNAGGWGAYIPVELAVQALAVNNRCATVGKDSVASKRPAEHPVSRCVYGDAPSGRDVVVYRVEGAGHSWHAADLDTGELLIEFFSRYIVPEDGR